MPARNGSYQRDDLPLDPMKFPVAVETMTATEIRFRMDEFERSPAMRRLQEGMEKALDQLLRKVFTTPIQFRFPRSKKKRIRKKWRKDPRNFRKLIPDGLEDIQIVGVDGAT